MGTRIPVTVILDSLAEGATKDEILVSYPSLRIDHINAALAYAVRQTQQFWMPPLLPIGSCSHSTRASPTSGATRFTTRAGVVLFRSDTSGRGAVIAFVRERLHKLLEMDLSRTG